MIQWSAYEREVSVCVEVILRSAYERQAKERGMRESGRETWRSDYEREWKENLDSSLWNVKIKEIKKIKVK